MILDDEEREIVEAYRAGKIKHKRLSKREQSKFRQVAKATLLKDKRVNIRISSQDLNELRSKALEEGLPYQTFLSSILHKFLNGRLVEITDNKYSVRILSRKPSSHSSGNI